MKNIKVSLYLITILLYNECSDTAPSRKLNSKGESFQNKIELSKKLQSSN